MAMLSNENQYQSGKQKEGNIIGFDFGQKRIGVAVGNNVYKTAQALITIDSSSNSQKFEAIQKIIEEWQPISIVVGVPFNVDGSEHKVTNLSKKFAKQLEQKYSLPTHLIDERYTSIEANHEIKDKKIDLKKKKLLIDQIAAKIILQSYLDQI
jgi:putative Holliday junction resolvase